MSFIDLLDAARGIPTGIAIDISLDPLPFERLVVQRAMPFEFAPDLGLRTYLRYPPRVPVPSQTRFEFIGLR